MNVRYSIVLLSALTAGSLAWGQTTAMPAAGHAPLANPAVMVAPGSFTPTSCCDGPADSCCFGEDGACGPPGRCWVRAEALWWWIKGDPLPPLVTTSPVGTAVEQAGVLGTGNTTTLFGDERVNDDVRFGGRFTAGSWLDCAQTIGIEANFLIVSSQSKNFDAGSNGDPILARPFFDVTTNQQSSELVAFPGVLAGKIQVAATSSNLLGAGALARANICCGCNYRIDAIGGYRYLRFNDRVAVTENLLSTDPNSISVIPGTTIDVSDQFSAHNEFHGFDAGLTGEFRRGRWVASWLAKLAIGKNFETVQINGSTTVTSPGSAPVTNAGGLLALQSNIGIYHRETYTVVPEFGFDLGYQITPQLRASVGYTFLYWADMVRAGNQIDSSVNPNLLPPVQVPLNGPFRPAPQLRESDFWAQGVNLGLEFRF